MIAAAFEPQRCLLIQMLYMLRRQQLIMFMQNYVAAKKIANAPV